MSLSLSLSWLPFCESVGINVAVPLVAGKCSWYHYSLDQHNGLLWFSKEMPAITDEDRDLLFQVCESKDARAALDVKEILEPYQGSIDFKVIRNEDGKTPLHVAAFEGNMAVCKVLIERYGASADVKDYGDILPEKYARFGAHTELAKYLEQQRSSSQCCICQ
eukprot:gb/GECG01012699.1/.p1 GENE.gb/GECG01012699.1/~~gb/GECG01012699.1/.p1  ORF type:complete len:163 (+),score=19.64 gb/GECG01012699.1/:1-489(+)